MPARPASTTFTPSKKHVRFLEACLDEASQGKMGFRLGAVVVKNGKIIGRGKNSVIRPTNSSANDTLLQRRNTMLPLSLHAEASALRSCLHHTVRTSLSRLPPYTIPSSSLSHPHLHPLAPHPSFSSSSSSASSPSNLHHYPYLSPPPSPLSPHPRKGSSKRDLASRDLVAGSTLYVGRFNRFEHGLTAKPCWRCVQMMAGLGVKKVVWTETNEELERERTELVQGARRVRGGGWGGNGNGNVSLEEYEGMLQYAGGSLENPSPRSDSSSRLPTFSLAEDEEDEESTSSSLRPFGDGLLYTIRDVADLWYEITQTRDLGKAGFLTAVELGLLGLMRGGREGAGEPIVGGRSAGCCGGHGGGGGSAGGGKRAAAGGSWRG